MAAAVRAHDNAGVTETILLAHCAGRPADGWGFAGYARVVRGMAIVSAIHASPIADRAL
jgi:hypothetical protein